MELHLYELLKIMSKRLRPSSDSGYGSEIFSTEETCNIQPDEKKTKNSKNLEVDDVPTKKTLMNRTGTLFNFLVTLAKHCKRNFSCKRICSK